eukprot:CAMPEP_0113462752 /NCGR_PEP_ID=MMETSP0014_2-20120614/12274_1 /TAXON_ID=2857 /ORGANISM="Nitzschia sp." /LENGTH=356 /DNA_ID=CAMNT_0000354665 /DNA_START=280 /DNA_END=1350 /DNA_ORIENTATION=+ /assembly_acc=CAM_ASM_000159
MQSSSPYDSMNTTTTTATTTTTIPFVSLYLFQGDRSKNQLSFPPHTLIDVDPTKQPNNGWFYGGYYHNESTAQFIKGWFPSSYVQRYHKPPLSSPLPPPPPPATQEQTRSRPRFNETFDVNLNNPNFNSCWPSNNAQQQVPKAEDIVMNNIDLYHRHDRGIPAEGFDSSSAMGGSMSKSSSRQLYRIDETGDCSSDDVTQVNRNKMTSCRKTNNDCEENSSSSNGFDVATNNIMGGNLPRSNNEGRTNKRDDGWGCDINDNNNDDEDKSKNNNNNHNKTKLVGGWFNQSFTLLTKNKRKVQPMTMTMMVSPSRKKAAKEPDWNAEPQIILPDGSIIEEYPTKKHGFLSFSQQFHRK